MRELVARDLGSLAYTKALEIQKEVHESVRTNSLSQGVILTVEHPPVITLGKSSDPSYILNLPQGVEVIETDRGGEVTAHLPGQVVVYPIFPLQRWQILPKNYVYLLEEAIISCLKNWGIQGERDPINPGVWVNQSKICAIGVRIKDRVSMHGLALNVDCDLSLFSSIVACGIRHRSVTRMKDHVNSVNIEEVKQSLVNEIKLIFS